MHLKCFSLKLAKHFGKLGKLYHPHIKYQELEHMLQRKAIKTLKYLSTYVYSPCHHSIAASPKHSWIHPQNVLVK